MDKYELIQVLHEIIENPDKINRLTINKRPSKYTYALHVAARMSRNDRDKKVLKYLVNNPGAKFYFFAPTDAVKPAILHAINILYQTAPADVYKYAVA